MIEAASPGTGTPDHRQTAPYGNLHIYYLGGRPGAGLARLGRDFIGNWQEEDCAFLFFSRPAPEAVAQLVAENSGLRLLDQFQMTYDEWQGGGWSAFRVGPLAIVPAWEPAGPCADAEAPTIRLDPGVVFGTGAHPTTRDCLEAIVWACREHAGQSALDLGTGTGLLALAAARLGYRRVLAVDLNHLAVRTARDNVRRNALTDRILTVQGRAEAFVSTPCDLMIANIHYDVMRGLIAAPGFLQKRRFILSGLLRSEVREVLYQLKKMPVTIANQWERDGIWHTLYGRIDTAAAPVTAG